MRTISRRIAVAYIISKDKKLLLGRKRPGAGGVYPDDWHTPGGGVDAHESDEQALAREVEEETGISLEGARIKLIDDKGTGEHTKTLPDGESVLARMQFIIYRVNLPFTSDEVALQESDDLEQLTWFDVDSLDMAQQTPPTRILMERIGTEWLRSDG